MAMRPLSHLLLAEGVRDPRSGSVPRNRRESMAHAVAVDSRKHRFLDVVFRLGRPWNRLDERGLEVTVAQRGAGELRDVAADADDAGRGAAAQDEFTFWRQPAVFVDAGEFESAGEEQTDLRLHIVNCLTHMRRFETAKQHCEEILARHTLCRDHRLMALRYFADASFRLGRYPIAKMAIDQADQILGDGDSHGGERDFAAHFAILKGNVAIVLSDPDVAAASYEEALRRFSSANHTFEACRTRVLLGAAYGVLGRTDEAEELLRTALRESEAAGYDRFSALALHHLGIVAYRSGDLRTAGSHLLRSNGLARSRDYVTLLFGNCYYLWRIARATGDAAAARAHFRSLRSLVGRVEEVLPEVEEFRAAIARGES